MRRSRARPVSPRHRHPVFLLALGAAVAALAFPAVAGAQSAEEELADRHAPVVRLVVQEEACGYGEPYEPIDVDFILGEETVALRGPWAGSSLVQVGPTADVLGTGKYEYHLDFPGDALQPGCSYEQWADRLGAAPPTTYARVVAEPARPGKLALQYWFFYVFNDYNNKHEGDWEMVQLVFDAATAMEALAEDPASVGYSQHSGAEAADWDDDKLELVDETHPVVYPAAGSHAIYFEPALYLGRSAAEGVGCDDTTGPSRELRPRVAFVPSERAAYERQYPWLAFEGRWGERQPSFYNGPTGPNDKRQWTEPISWADAKFREESLAIPAGGALGSGATDFFCEAVATGSNVLTKMTENPWPVVLALLGAIVLALWGVSRTDWRPSAPLHIARRRTWGQIPTASWRMYRSRPGLFALIGITFIPVGVLISLVQSVLLGSVLLPLESEGESHALVAAVALGIGLLFTVMALTIVQAATARAMVEVDAGRPISPAAAYRKSLDSIRPLFGGLLIAAAVFVVLELTVVGLPIAVWLVVRWSLIAQVIEVEGVGATRALHRSAELVRGRWLRVASITLVVTSLGLVLGPLLGALLLLVSDASFTLVNLVAGIVYAAVMPFVAVATTYLYFDLRVREHLAPDHAKHGEVLPAELDPV